MLLTLDGEVCMMPCMEPIIPGDIGKGFDEQRAHTVIAYVRKFLDETIPLENGSWNEISDIKIKGNDIVFL